MHEWLKKAVLLSFRLHDSAAMEGGAWDKVPLKTAGWGANRFREAGFRAVPGSVVRRSAFIAPGVVLMPSFVNVGAHVGADTMVDTWATVGSCAQIGRKCHISGGAGIGGVLEPLQAAPVVIEDECFIGARSEVAEGVVVGQGSVLAMGVFLGASTKIVDRATGEVFVGRVPPYSVVVPGTLPGRALPDGTPGPGAVLRRDREAGGRADPVQDLDQRAAAGLAAAVLDPVALTQALIRCPSVTPADAGALDVVAERLAGSASPCTGWHSTARPTCSPGAARPGRICASPAIPTWCRPATPRGRPTRSAASCGTARWSAAAPAT